MQSLNHWTTREVPKLCSYPKYAVTVGSSLNVLALPLLDPNKRAGLGQDYFMSQHMGRHNLL